ncbi:hypothetical protein AAW14_20360 [Streptomyces hygroscopicus]|uniref:hypothetical protein n=1 Tax=Streptomyces hygroscopicus TaxID=1912 RepID=UPI00223F0F75|nr:hypothetical protein [Streptomyces hygroscopicus]MCW7944316.1 hypothetical protein [Streptomyces hygroscopicus]
MQTPYEDNGEASTPFWKQRSRLLAAGFLAAVLVLSLISLVTAGGSDGMDAQHTAPGLLSAQSASAHGRPGTCRTDDTDTSVPRSAPRDVQWRTIGGTQVPTSPSAGPTLSEGPVLWCFAHTPMGAVMAAHVIPAQMSGPNWRTVAEEQVVAGFGRDMFASQRASIPEASVKERETGRYAGFSLADYSRDKATVVLLINTVQGGFNTTSLSVRWSGGDWKIEPGTDGGLHSTVSPVSGADGFVRWEV